MPCSMRSIPIPWKKSWAEDPWLLHPPLLDPIALCSTPGTHIQQQEGDRLKEMLQIHMLGRFEVIVDDQRIDQRLRKSTKGWTLIKYLLLHMGEEVPYDQLYEVLWPKEESTNPENALKTLVSRLRAFLGGCSRELGACILTKHGAYSWNQALSVDVDMLTFESVCGQALQVQWLDSTAVACFEQVLGLYAGDLLPASAQEGWVIPRSVQLHDLYLRTVGHYLDLLKAAKAYDEVIPVCRRALEIDAFDERLHMDLIDALIKTHRNNEAMLQYRHANNIHIQTLGVQPPEGLQAFYQHILKAGQVLDENIGAICGELRAADRRKGPFVCDYGVFCEIYSLQTGNLQRLGVPIFVALLMISGVGGQGLDPLQLDEMMRRMQKLLGETLRKGDTVSQYNASQFAILLPNVNYETGKGVLERIKRLFYQAYPHSQTTCTYRLGPVTESEKEG